MNTALFHKIAALGGTEDYEYTPVGVLKAAGDAKAVPFSNSSILRSCALLVLFSLLGLAMLPGPRRLELVLSLAGMLTILLFFTVRGRAPQRVWLALLLSPLGLVLLDLVLEEKPAAGRRTEGVIACVLLAGAVCCLAAAAPGLDRIRPQLAVNTRQNVDLGECARLMEDDNLYVWQDAGNRVLQPVMNQGKLIFLD